MGGAQSAIDMYEACIISSLLTNAGTWVEMNEESVNRLDNIQDTFSRALLALPLSAPRASLRASLGLPGLKWRVWEQKILLAQAIRQQEEGGLAREVLEEQITMGWPGLIKEVQNICKTVGLQDITKCYISRKEIIEYIKF